MKTREEAIKEITKFIQEECAGMDCVEDWKCGECFLRHFPNLAIVDREAKLPYSRRGYYQENAVGKTFIPTALQVDEATIMQDWVKELK